MHRLRLAEQPEQGQSAGRQMFDRGLPAGLGDAAARPGPMRLDRIAGGEQIGQCVVPASSQPSREATFWNQATSGAGR